MQLHLLGCNPRARVQKDFDEERQRASHQTIERKSFGMSARFGVCTRETGERSIQDTQNFDRGPVQLQN